MPRNARKDNNYRDYPVEVLYTLTAIRNLKQLGFTLEEIREIIVRQQIDALDHTTMVRIIEQKIIHLDAQVDKLLLYKHRLQEARMRMEGEQLAHIVPLTEITMRAA